jgi:predicted NBD/HSP70 family sugar kinase
MRQYVKPQIVNTTRAHQANRQLILDTIRARGRVSSAELARTLGVPSGTVARVVKSLKREGLLRTRRARENLGVGRPPVFVEVNRRFARFVGVELGQHTTRIALADFQGAIIAQEAAATSILGPDPVGGMLTRVKSFLARHAADGSAGPVRAVGMGVSGNVSLTEGQVVHGFLPGGTALAPLLREALGTEAFVDNDANLAAVAESVFGAARGFSHVVCLLDRGFVGSGLIIEGALYRGANNAAGELCADIIWNGSQATEARPPFMESLALERAARECGLALRREDFPARSAMAAAVWKAARDGDERAAGVVRRVTDTFATALYRLAVLFDPELLVLSGDWTASGAEGEAALRAAYESLWNGSKYGWGFRRPQVVFSSLGQDAVTLGAIAAAIEKTTREAAHNGGG